MTETNQCPKCGFASDMSFSDCPKCGIVISKFLAIEKERKEFEAAQHANQGSSSGPLENAQGFMIWTILSCCGPFDFISMSWTSSVLIECCWGKS